MELIQYSSSTRRVRAEPVLIVPSIVNKFYLTDLSPGRSLVEHLVETGHAVFSISWVNPDGSHRDLRARRLRRRRSSQAIDAAREINGCERVHLLGVCAGGQLASIVAAYLAAIGRQRHRRIAVAARLRARPASTPGCRRG